MISFDNALDILLTSAVPLGTEEVSLQSSAGRVLASDIRSDIDMPPFDKSAVDGFACRMAGDASPMRVTETIAAGSQPHHTVAPGECARIMTGAMVPEGADTVIMVEDTEELSDGRIRFLRNATAPNICYQGEDIRNGELVLASGSLITPQAIAVLASVGEVSPLVFRPPSVGVISTGDELVEPSFTPGPAKIRDSNSSQLMAQIGRINLPALDFGISGDSKEALYEKISVGLAASDVLILSGGVSMGDFDYVPAIMKEHGIAILFQSIAVQPGRPTVFGRKGDQYVFGLPGNPVSSFVIFEMLVKPFLYQLMGHRYSPLLIRLPLAAPVRRRNTARKAILPVFIREGEIFPVNYHGSAHIHSYIHAHGLIAVETGVTELNQGELHDVRLL